MKTAGIDGCKAGWLLISFDENDSKYEVLRSEQALKEAFEQFDRIFINIPIGLEDENFERESDTLLREKLGSEYAEDVIDPPIRPALVAPSYVEANMTSFDFTERNLTLQAWNITPKIKMVDNLLRENKTLQDKVLETYPEFLYQQLNGGMIYQKKNLKKGIKHRLELVREKEPKAEDFFREIKEDFRRNEVEEHDIVDALVMAYFAKAAINKDLKTLPAAIQPDSEGLKRAIHYV